MSSGYGYKERTRDPIPGEPAQASCADSGTSNVKFHVVTRVGRCWVPACNMGGNGVTLMSHDTLPAHTIRPGNRCRKPACRKAFEAADAAAGDPR